MFFGFPVPGRYLFWRAWVLSLFLFIQIETAGGNESVNVTQTPYDIEGFLKIEEMLKKVVPSVDRHIVFLKSDSACGTGILVSGSGDVFTAHHVVCDDNDQLVPMKAVLCDGSEREIELVAADSKNDAAIVRLKDKKNIEAWCELARREPTQGEWVFSMGHGNGYNESRGAPVRLGRVITAGDGIYKTDCKLIGGDSGGPLFNLRGELLGIHSRVGMDLEINIHIPVSVFRKMDVKEQEENE